MAIDFYGNYITNSHDNPIEADGGMHNIRIMNNMLINHPSHAFCNQPALGGPVYWIRNIAYHLPGGSTRITAGSAGVVFYNNTILSETSVAGASNAHWRNNLFLGEESQDMIFSVTSLTDYSSSDFNGFRPNPAAAAAFSWRSPSSGSLADISDPDYEAQLQSVEGGHSGRLFVTYRTGPQQYLGGLQHFRERSQTECEKYRFSSNPL